MITYVEVEYIESVHELDHRWAAIINGKPTWGVRFVPGFKSPFSN